VSDKEAPADDLLRLLRPPRRIAACRAAAESPPDGQTEAGARPIAPASALTMTTPVAEGASPRAYNQDNANN
jgi:hypothetical protein